MLVPGPFYTPKPEAIPEINPPSLSPENSAAPRINFRGAVLIHRFNADFI
jgi:hypothetical protein